MPPQRTLLTTMEVAEWLGVSVPTIRRAMTMGLPSKLLGSRRRFAAADIEKWWKLNEPARSMPKRAA